MHLSLAVLALLSSEPSSACVVSGTRVSLDHVRVRRVDLSVHEVVARARPDVLGGWRVDVDGPVTIRDAHAPLWLSLARDYTSDDGLVHLARGAHLVEARRSSVPGHVDARAVLYADDVLEHENDKLADVDVTVRVPCDVLTLDWVGAAADGSAADSAAAGDDVRYWFTRKSALKLRAAIGAGGARDSRTLRAPACSAAAADVVEEGYGCIQVAEIERRGAWMLVEVDGELASVRGWVPAAELKPIPEHVLVVRTYGCHGHHGGASSRDVWAGEQPADWYEGLARARAGGARVVDERGRVVATVSEGVPLEVEHCCARREATVVSLPNVSFAPGAWVGVARDDIVIDRAPAPR